ncbi:MAG: DMT family transporter, partial [Candidatus Cloacimonetes bacterium]|nr:DMT family transporter [Candidatus Cloacimonadota bacterium]
IVIFLAAMLIVKPRFDFSIMPAIAGFGSAIFAGAAYTLVRFLGNKEKPETIIFFFSLVTSILMLIPLYGKFIMPNPKQLIFLLGTGIFAAIGQFGLTYSYRLAPATEVAVYNYSSIVVAAIIGFSLWHEVPDLLSAIGGILIIITSILLFLHNKTKRYKVDTNRKLSNSLRA